MDKESILALLRNTQVAVTPATTTSSGGTTWYNIRCPLAPYTHAGGSDNTPSFGITVNESGYSVYKCFACGAHGKLAALPTRIGGYRGKDYTSVRHDAELAELDAINNRVFPSWDAYTEQENITKRAPPRPERLTEYPSAIGVPYLRRRGIHYLTVQRLGLRYDAIQRRVLFPVYNESSVFMGFTGRSILPPSRLSKRNPKVRDYLGLDKSSLLLSMPKRKRQKTILVEGLFDYANLVEKGYYDAAANLGTAMTHAKLATLIAAGDPVYLLMDNDLAGWSSMFGIRKGGPDSDFDTSIAWAFRLHTEVPVWIVPYTRPLDGADPGSLSRQELSHMFAAAWLFNGSPPLDEIGEPTLCVGT